MRSFIAYFLLLTLGNGLSIFSQKLRPNAYIDRPYAQDYSVKYYLQDSSIQLRKVLTDNDGRVRILTSAGVFLPYGGKFQYPGQLRPDRSYIPIVSRKIADITLHQGQLVFLDNRAVFSNAWAGKVYGLHQLSSAQRVASSTDFTFLVADNQQIKRIENNTITDEETIDEALLDLIFDAPRNRYLLLLPQRILAYSLATKELTSVFQAKNMTCFALAKDSLFVGTAQGYFSLSTANFKASPLQDKLPCQKLTAIAYINGNLWMGSPQGAFMRRAEGGFNYYFGERWIPSNRILQIVSGPNKTVHILTDRGLGELHFDPITLHDKAMVYEEQVRQRHIRYGFNCDVSTLKNGDLSTFEMGQRDSDNLWTSMYLVSQLFRYKVTGDPKALQNCLESFEAMQRLFSITNMKGYFARGFERHGHHKFKATPWDGGMTNGWVQAKDSVWDWRGTTSSDQTVGQMFALTLLAQNLNGEVKQKAIHLMDDLMTNIIENDWYLIDFDGKPTLWGKWNPVYVNGFSKTVGDRKLYSSNIIGFLQTAYHFTKKEIYRQKAYELMQKHGYLENLMRPMAEIGRVEENQGKLAAELSEEWNHSDDEMYFLAYWCLYPYAFTPELKKQYFHTIKEHWEFERPEKNGLWNLCYAMTGAQQFDQKETIWYLKEFPLDMIEWQVINSHRKDIVPVSPNFRVQTITQVLPPDERPELKHNRNLFKLDRLSNGQSELSAGDSFLLPYWMGRYLGIISAPSR